MKEIHLLASERVLEGQEPSGALPKNKNVGGCHFSLLPLTHIDRLWEPVMSGKQPHQETVPLQSDSHLGEQEKTAHTSAPQVPEEEYFSWWCRKKVLLFGVHEPAAN